jgi:hypothetical protein
MWQQATTEMLFQSMKVQFSMYHGDLPIGFLVVSSATILLNLIHISILQLSKKSWSRILQTVHPCSGKRLRSIATFRARNTGRACAVQPQEENLWQR